MKTIIWVLMGVLVGMGFDGRSSFAQVAEDGSYFSDPNLIDDSLPPDQVSAVQFQGYNSRRIEAEEIQPEVAVQVYELSKWLKEVYDHLQKQER